MDFFNFLNASASDDASSFDYLTADGDIPWPTTGVRLEQQTFTTTQHNNTSNPFTNAPSSSSTQIVDSSGIAHPAPSSTGLNVLKHPPIKSFSRANLPITLLWEGREKLLPTFTSAEPATMQSSLSSGLHPNNSFLRPTCCSLFFPSHSACLRLTSQSPPIIF